jgi:hypothetical protein
MLPALIDGKYKTADNHTFNQAWAEMEKIYASGRATEPSASATLVLKSAFPYLSNIDQHSTHFIQLGETFDHS